MFMFMEGLPGAGKSFETCVYYILAALIQGRPVDAYVEGLNYQMFSDLTGKPLEEIERLLRALTRDQVKEIHLHARKDALVVIDELQNFFQKSRQPLRDEITKFITEHRHEGQDIIGMGQDLNDVHNMWRRRCAKKFVFQTKDMVGKPDSYTWVAYQGKRTDKDIKFVKINSGSRDYDEKYFGLYKSHSDGTSNFETFKDDRTNIFNNKSLRYGVPAVLAIAVGAIYYLVTVVFSGSGIVTQDQLSISESQVNSATPAFHQLESEFQSQPSSPASFQSQSQPVDTSPDDQVVKYSPPEDYIDTVANEYKLRLAGVAKNPRTGSTIAIIQAFDTSLHMKERFTTEEIQALGWDVEITGYGVRLYRDERQYVVRPWPIDPFGRVNQATIRRLRAEPPSRSDAESERSIPQASAGA